MLNFHTQLTPVDLSALDPDSFATGTLPDSLAGIDIGIRPCRSNGPNISAVESGQKLLIHNYGHGGAGWSLSHGSVLHALSLFEDRHCRRSSPITIIGAGVMGLLTSLYLYERGYRNLEIVAREFEGITSCRSTGYYAPLAMSLNSDKQQAFINDIGFTTFTTFQAIQQGSHPLFKVGISPVNVYAGTGDHSEGTLETQTGLEPYVAKGLLPEPELGEIDFGNGQKHVMRRFQTYFMNTPDIMAELTSLLNQRGIRRTQKNINEFSEINSDIIFNCSGIGARLLNHDNNIHPNLGVLLLLKQPIIEQLHYIIYTRYRSPWSAPTEDNYIYFMPRGNGLLGATFIPFNEGTDEAENMKQVRRIILENKAFFGT
ncbi:FAD-dependent oxidoreductase [Endozoicomonas lisbonensis]|uniref:D-amino-acid oxidase n=1 Tax=Endozoicomonas lisbonensis TaxID=3120522 RepID=A0ABV2SFF1_9GAMM